MIKKNYANYTIPADLSDYFDCQSTNTRKVTHKMHKKELHKHEFAPTHAELRALKRRETSPNVGPATYKNNDELIDDYDMTSGR